MNTTIVLRKFFPLLLFIFSLQVQAQKGSSCPEDLVPGYDENKKAWGYKNLFGMWVVDPIYTKVSPYVENKAVVQNGLLFGVIDCDANVILQCQYQKLTNFRYGKIWAMKNNLWGLVDQKGKVLMDFQFTDINPIKLTELTWLKKGELWGLFNEETGQWTCKPAYEIAQTLSDKSSLVQVGDKFGVLNHVNCNYLVPLTIDKVRKFAPHVIAYRENNKWGIFNDAGKIIVEPKFDSIGAKYDAYYYIVKSNGLYGIIEWNGKEIMPVKYQEIGDYKNGFFRVKENGKYGYASKLGKIYIKAEYDNAYDFANNEAVVMKHGKYGVIDIRNGEKIPLQYYNIVPSANNDFYVVYTKEMSQPGDKAFILKSPLTMQALITSTRQMFEEVMVGDTATRIRVKTGGKYRFYNVTTASFAFIGSYDKAEGFKMGYAIVANGDKYGVVNEFGMSVIPFSYEKIEYDFFSNKLVFKTQVAGKYGIVESNGKVAFENQYELISWCAPNYLKLKKDGKYGIYKTSGDIVIDFLYDHLSNRIENPALPDWPAVFVHKTKYGFVNEKGVEIAIAKATGIEFLGGNLYKAKFAKGFGLVNSTGTIFDGRYDDIQLFHDGLAAVVKAGKWGFINSAGEEMVKLEYEEVSSFTNRIASVKITGKYGVVNTKGKLIVPAEYDSYKIDSEGNIIVLKSNQEYRVGVTGIIK